MQDRTTPLADVLELAELERPVWEAISAGIPAWHPRAETPPAPAPTPPAPTPPAPPAGDPPAPTPPPAPAGDPSDDEPVTMTRAELNALTAERDEAKAAAARAARQAREKGKQGKQEAGQFEELYGEEKQRADKLEGAFKSSAIGNAVTEAAQRLHFRNPTLAARVIDTAGIDVDVDAESLEAALSPAAKAELERRLKVALEADPYLADTPPARQLAGAGGNSGNGGDNSGNAAMNRAIRAATGRV